MVERKKRGKPLVAEREGLARLADPKIVRDITLMHLMRFVDLINLLSKHNPDFLSALSFLKRYIPFLLGLPSNTLQSPIEILYQFRSGAKKKKRESISFLTSVTRSCV